MPVVVVESPAKAKTIKKYLGKNYHVVASFGHIRDLPTKDGSVDPDQEFSMKWEVPKASTKHIQEIVNALKQDQDLILATDPDREGEAISWHIKEVLNKKRGVKLVSEPKRVVFNSVTKSSVQNAIDAPRQIDMELVNAYLTRRALDYLVGYRLSPVLWRKLPGARSAGRVQSVCVRIIVERETEIDNFDTTEYWTVTALFNTPTGERFAAQLTQLDSKKLAKFGLNSKTDANRAVEAIIGREFQVSSVQTKPTTNTPPPPFMTATMQQEASRKLRMSPRVSMRVAQKLYEDGLITYMRTDAIFMVPEAITEARKVIQDRFGNEYLPEKPRIFKSKAKNAQEAHECIRPTSLSKDAKTIVIADSDQRQLYELIWNRTVASQMQSAVFLQTRADILSTDKIVGLRATGRITKFNGYQRLYQEGQDDKEADNDAETAVNEKTPLPPLEENTPLKQEKVTPKQHFTKPPPRYSEASLVKKMVELGIGRPSTYSSIVATIQDRGYVLRQSGKLVPQPIGKLLVFFLKLYFERYVEFKFTAKLEEELDDIASGRKKYQQVLEGFWGDFSESIQSAQGLRLTEVLDRLADIVVPLLVPPTNDRADARSCPKCNTGRLVLRLSKTNAAIGCSNSPECDFRKGFDGSESRSIGNDPTTGLPISVLVGNYGPYLQLGSTGEQKEKPKRASIPKDIGIDNLDLDTALALLSLPKTIGNHPTDNEPIIGSIGPYGPYLKHAGKYANLKTTPELLSINLEQAVEKLAEKRARGTKGGAQGKSLGKHPEGGIVTLNSGRFGPYVKWNRTNASVPKNTDPETITLDDAIALLAVKKKKVKRK